jgi:hypothetical protein
MVTETMMLKTRFREEEVTYLRNCALASSFTSFRALIS